MNDETAEWLGAEMRDIRRRVRAVPGLSIRRLLLDAEVSYSTWWRWEQYTVGKPGGQVARMDRIARVKSALAEHEAERDRQATADQ